MAKEFKNYDRAFTSQQIYDCREKWLHSGSIEADRNSYTNWPEKVSSWPNDFIRACVYLMSDSEEWQLFRVSMKGLATSHKLYMLHNRFVSLVKPLESDDPTGENWMAYKREKCRIDNYIGALVRGGQLNANLEIVR